MEVINKLAPHLTGQLSPKAQQAVADRRASGSLSPYATPNTAALRREETERDQESVLRPAFVRDAEKIMHMSAYNRLAGKTQVFSFRADDDLARRGLHVQLVARVAKDIGAALGLNLDLIEAIALGHDIGHTPFGHAGERFLNDVYHARTGRFFAHNVQSVYDIFSKEEAEQLTARNKKIIREIAERTQIIETGVEELINARKVANKIENEREKAIAYHDTVAPKMEEIRYHIDKLELIVSDELWTLPKYRELLFIR